MKLNAYISSVIKNETDMSNQLLGVTKERINLLNGCEVQSLTYEGCVAVKGNKVYRGGKVVDTLDTDEKVLELWSEYIRGEGF